VVDIGKFFLELPPPFGMIVTFLQPAVAIAAGVGAVIAFRRYRTAIAAVLGALALVAFVGIVAIQIAIDDSLGNVALTIGGPALVFACLIVATILERRRRSLG
jgi:uncharacterized membrane protein YoaK (UPF0700 family)